MTSATHCLPEIQFEEQELTSFGGLVMFKALLLDLDLRTRLRAVVRHLPSSGGYCASRIILLLIVHLSLGWRRLRDLDYYRDNPLVKHVLGLDRMPNLSTVSRRLTEFDARAVENLRGLLRDLVATRGIASSPKRLTLDFDGSVISTRARGIEGTAVGWLCRPTKNSSSAFPCVIYRRRVAKPRKGPIQLDLFEPIERDYEFKVVMTNKSLSPGALLRFHNGRGSQEARFAEAKAQLGLGYLPSRRQVGNQVYMLCNLIAFALGRELQMRATPTRSHNTATRACLWALERVGTFRHRLIKRAARITHPQGRFVLSFASCPDATRDLRRFVEAAREAA